MKMMMAMIMITFLDLSSINNVRKEYIRKYTE
jgi:hypothetical protein